MGIDIGKLNQRITFLKAEWKEDELGQEKSDLTPYKTVWATVKALRGNEYYEAQKLQPELTYKVYTRYHSGITPDMRVLYKEKVFEIKSVINVDESDYMLEIQCIEYVEGSDMNGTNEF